VTQGGTITINPKATFEITSLSNTAFAGSLSTNKHEITNVKYNNTTNYPGSNTSPQVTFKVNFKISYTLKASTANTKGTYYVGGLLFAIWNQPLPTISSGNSLDRNQINYLRKVFSEVSSRYDRLNGTPTTATDYTVVAGS